MEEKTVEIIIDDKYTENIQKLLDEGWQLREPGVAKFNLVRQQAQGMGVKLTFGIDDSKIGILRDGKIVG